VVDRGSDSFVECYIVHPPLIGQAEQYYVGKHAILISFSDVPYT
jgi:hypothetical protein